MSEGRYALSATGYPKVPAPGSPEACRPSHGVMLPATCCERYGRPITPATAPDSHPVIYEEEP